MEPSSPTSLLPPALPLNPLDLPEILTRVGQFLPLWNSEEFRPAVLLRCSLVSKSWRKTLLPILWFFYDSYRMLNVPSEILVKHSHYFRIVYNVVASFKGPFHCRNLIELSTVYGQEWSRQLLADNPGLKRLRWAGPHHSRIETLEQHQELSLELKALMKMENLNALDTFGFSLGEGLFVKVLMNNANRLSNLTLSTVEGLTSIEGLELPYLTELDIKFGGVDSPALVDLVRCCPRLQRLSVTGSRSKSPSPSPIPFSQHGMNLDATNIKGSLFDRLAQNITECCPDLSAIKVAANMTGHDQYFLDDREYTAIVNASRRLESFSADLLQLDYGLTEALVGQRRSLKVLSLSFFSSDAPHQQGNVDYPKGIHCLRRLKASLTRLNELAVIWEKNYSHACDLATTAANIINSDLNGSSSTTGQASSFQEELLAFFEEPWGCSDLRNLQLSNFPLTRTQQMPSSANPSSPVDASKPLPLSPIAPSWRLVEPVKYTLRAKIIIRELAAILLELDVPSLTKLRHLKLDQLTYEREQP
ncbi:MAG: hypothetical protein J3Q66DRAFT_359782 [Benniella sp.]|nr:MAG: hypothetical protein J3Q66DRAFT_359782 [Benniella sp.]